MPRTRRLDLAGMTQHVIQRGNVRLYAQRQRALGSDRFQVAIERQLDQRAGIGRPGRPRVRAPAPAQPPDLRGTRSADGLPEGSSVAAAEKVL